MLKNNLISLEEMKKIELDILIYIDKICKKNDIQYSIAGGTLLGAVRHKGFIPWDDDIDVFMTRANYIKFIDVLKKENNNKYLLLNANIQKDYYYAFSKIVNTKTTMIETDTKKIKDYGIYVDLFPIDNIPDDLEERRLFLKKVNKYKKMLDLTCSIRYKNKSKLNLFLRKIIYFCSSSRLSNYFAKKIDFLSQKYYNKKTQEQGTVVGGYGEKEIMKKNIYNEYIKIKFENHYFQALKNYDFYLKKLYGNYMELPPKEKRISHHSYVVKWKE